MVEGKRSLTLDEARKSGLSVEDAGCCLETELVVDIITRLKPGPLHVTAPLAGSERLVGFISAFDLL